MAVLARTRSRDLSLVHQALLCTCFAAGVAVFARVAFPLPFTPVVFSLGPLAVMLTGMVLGSRLGFLALLEYLAAGALGAPVFQAGNGGMAYMLAAPTLGYLLSYPFAAAAVGLVSEAGRHGFVRLWLAGLLGLAVIYMGGNAYLSFWLQKGALQTLLFSAAPFVVFDVVKAAIAAGAARGADASPLASYLPGRPSL